MNWAYLAGFTDGDGCISVVQRRRATVRSTRSLWVALRWAQATDASDVIDALARFLEGAGVAFTIGDRSPRGFPQRELVVQRREDVLHVLRALEPHLVLKREKAREAIALIEAHEAPRRCSVEGCDEPYKAVGFCNRHYQAAWQRGEVGRGVSQ